MGQECALTFVGVSQFLFKCSLCGKRFTMTTEGEAELQKEFDAHREKSHARQLPREELRRKKSGRSIRRSGYASKLKLGWFFTAMIWPGATVFLLGPYLMFLPFAPRPWKAGSHKERNASRQATLFLVAIVLFVLAVVIYYCGK